MDLYDSGSYFSRQGSLRALSNPLVRYAACAYAAKQMGLVQERNAIVGIGASQSQTKASPSAEEVDWKLMGTTYYDKAMSLLLEEVPDSSNLEFPLTSTREIGFDSTPQNNFSSSPVPNKMRCLLRLAPGGNVNDADDTLTAAAILCVYEFLDIARAGWALHGSGTKALFNMVENESLMPVLQSPNSPDDLSRRLIPSRARIATFWAFARQDLLAAC